MALSITIAYGDGKSYMNTSDHLGAVFTHTYRTPGVYHPSITVLTPDGVAHHASCSFVWNRPAVEPAVGTCSKDLPFDFKTLTPTTCQQPVYVLTRYADSITACSPLLAISVNGDFERFACFASPVYYVPSYPGTGSTGGGYTVGCADGTVSPSGGRQGACSYHGGVG